MPSFTIIAFFLLTFCSRLAFAVDDPLPPEQVFKVSAQALSAQQIELSFTILDGYYLYRDKIKVTSKTEPIQLAAPSFPAGETKHDEAFGDMVIYRQAVKVPLAVSGANGSSSLQIAVQYQGCADRGLCYPPQKKIFDLILPAAASSSADPLAQLVKTAAAVKLNLFEDELLPPEQAFQFFASVKDPQTLHVNWLIAPGYYLYKEKVQLQITDSAGVTLGSPNIPAGTPKEDEAFGKVEIFHDELGFDVPLIRSNTAAQAITLKAKFQGCADRGVCYPPMTKDLTLQLPATTSLTQAASGPANTSLSEQDQIVKAMQQDSLGMTLVTFLGFGLLLSLTPCVFPMVPILSGIIIGQGKNTSTLHGFLLSLSYVTASAATYTVFGVLAALFGSNLQTTFQQPWIIALFSAIFVLLSLSMFGFYHLELPDFIRAKLHNSSEKHRNGSFWGAAIMGSLSSLIVGPCVAAPLAGALIYIGQTGDAILGGSSLFVMGMGMGVPLLLLGASAGKLLPQKGTWLNSVNAVFGVIMLAVAVWMLSRILPAEITMLLWAMLLVLPAIYLNAIDPLPELSSGWRKLWKGIGIMMLSYGLMLLIGFSLGNTNPLKPLQGLGINNATATPQTSHFEKISSVSDLQAKLQQAGAHGQRVMLDFYADWCISCKEMEAYTFADGKVKQELADFMLLQADVTNNSDADKALLAKFNLIGPPGVIFFSPDQHELTSHRVIGYQDAATFIQTLQRVKS
ncbi:MAG: protein-disulfide reductase DsbD [Methylococcales bacterium]